MEYLTLTFTAPNQDVVINELVALSSKHQCHIQESRFSLLGRDFCGIFRIGGNWSDIAKLEEALQVVVAKKEILLTLKRSESEELEGDFLPYLVQVVALETPAITNEITYFFSAQQIQIIDLQTDPFKTLHSETSMLTLSLRLSIPADINIADLRERFMVLCDELNVDGILEPEKR